jgi:hypothetical protein
MVKERLYMFFEGLGSASVVNGVLRIETYTRNAKGEDVVAGELVIPNSRVLPVLQGLQQLVGKIMQQDNATQQATGDAASTEGAPE